MNLLFGVLASLVVLPFGLKITSFINEGVGPDIPKLTYWVLRLAALMVYSASMSEYMGVAPDAWQFSSSLPAFTVLLGISTACGVIQFTGFKPKIMLA